MGAMVMVLQGCGGDPGFMASQMCANECFVEIRCVEDKCTRVPNDNCKVKESGPCSHHEACADFMNEGSEKQLCDLKSACCAFNSVLVGDNKDVDPTCTAATSAPCFEHPNSTDASEVEAL